MAFLLKSVQIEDTFFLHHSFGEKGETVLKKIRDFKYLKLSLEGRFGELHGRNLKLNSVYHFGWDSDVQTNTKWIQGGLLIDFRRFTKPIVLNS